MKFKSLVIGLSIALLALYFTVRNVSWEELEGSMKSIHFAYIFSTALIIVLSYVARALRWRILLLPIKRIKVQELFSPLMVGSLGNILPARAGEVIRAYLLGKKQNISITGSLATIVVEFLFDLVILLFLVGWLLIFHADIFNHSSQLSGISMDHLARRFGVITLCLMLLLMVFIYMLLSHPGKVMRWIRWTIRPLPHGWQEKLMHFVERFRDGLSVIRDMNALGKIAFYSFLVWSLVILSFYPLYWAYDVQDKSLEALLMLVIVVVIMLAVLPTPGFLGSFQAGVLIALHQVMQETELVAASYGMVAWALNFGVLFVTGVYFILHDHLSVRRLAKIGEEV